MENKLRNLFFILEFLNKILFLETIFKNCFQKLSFNNCFPKKRKLGRDPSPLLCLVFFLSLEHLIV